MRSLRLLVLVAVLGILAVPAASALDIEGEPNVLADAVVGQPYSHQFIGEEGCPPSYDFHLAAGSAPFPPGLVLDRKTGELRGVPTAPGDYHFFVELTDGEPGPLACNSTPSQADFHIRVLPQLVVTTPALGPVRAGAAFSTTLSASGGGSLSWSVGAGSLPPGLSLTPQGVLAGTAAAPGSYTFTARVQDPGPKRVGTREFTFVVAAPLALSAPAAGASEVGVPFKATVGTSGGAQPIAWSVAQGSLPAGVTLDAATGALSGTPTAAGSFSATLAATDAVGYSASTTVAVSVAPRLAVATRRLATAKLGARYRVKLAKRGGVGAVRWQLVRGPLPAGIRLDARTGTLAGVARAVGTRRVTIAARDALGVVARRTLVLRVAR
ncbi:MAG TPA: Ig domain-containing protein [Gaiellaceae bacterium]|nr:Ig domain-containing protein [Gaiellaceae bacterium]